VTDAISVAIEQNHLFRHSTIPSAKFQFLYLVQFFLDFFNHGDGRHDSTFGEAAATDEGK
jgi:hypothetical protein